MFTDAGAAALARRDAPEQAERLTSLSDRRRLQRRAAESEEPSEDAGVLVLVAPSQAEYSEVEEICLAHRGAVVLLNGRLEDAAIGIGSVARERRRGFLATWESAYA